MIGLSLLSAFMLSAPHRLDTQPELHDLANRARVLLGSCAVASLVRDDIKYAAALAQDANLIEPENDLKPPAIWQGPGQYNFSNPDVLLGEPGKKGWAQEHQMTVRGHVLVYPHDQGYTTPQWILREESKISPEQARDMLRDYIHAVVGRYKGKIAMWDVVNEAIDDQPNSRPLGLHDSFWLRKLGPDFLVDAFKFAHEADPRAKLYYNDYGFEDGNAKADRVFALIDYVREHGGPIDGLGFQYHVWLANAVKPGDGHEKTFRRTQEKKLDFMITELDVALPCISYPRSDPRHGMIPKDPDLLNQQAEVYRGIFQMALSFKNCRGIQLWGFTDAHSWISGFQNNMGAALDFDADFQPKPAAKAIAEVLTQHSK